MNIVRTLSIAAGLSLVASLVPSDSNAAWRRVASSACVVTQTDGDFFVDDDGFGVSLSDVGGHTLVKTGAYAQYSSSYSKQVMCPLEDTSEFSKSDIDRINVHTYDGSSNSDNFTRAYTCAVSPYGLSSSCEAAEGASGSGYKTLTLSSQTEVGLIQSSYASAFFASLRVYMRVRTANRPQRFMGFWISD